MTMYSRRVVTPLNRTVSFFFETEIVSYLAGIAYFEITYGKTDHLLKEVHLSTKWEHPSGNIILVTVEADIKDDSGDDIDSQDSLATVVVLAWDTLPSTVAFGSVTGLANGQTGPGGGIPITGPPVISVAFLSGFDLSYQDDNWIKSASAGAALGSPTSNLGYITASAAMADSSGHNATTATVDGWLLAASVADPGFAVIEQADLQTQNPVTVRFSVPAGQAVVDGAVLLQNFSVQYPVSNNWIKTLGAGAMDWSIDGNAITLTNARAFMWDNSGHYQDDNNSNASLVVVAVLGSDPKGRTR